MTEPSKSLRNCARILKSPWAVDGTSASSDIGSDGKSLIIIAYVPQPDLPRLDDDDDDPHPAHLCTLAARQ